MPKFNPDFWEVTLASESWGHFAHTDRLGYESPEDLAARHERLGRLRAHWPTVEALIREVLTDQQREVVLLTFFEGLNQRQVAERLGISQQAVSEHLYGKTRHGHTVGGALRKLRKALAAHGLHLD